MSPIPSNETSPAIVRSIAATLREADEEALQWATLARGRTDWRTIIVLTTTALALTMQQYLFDSDNLDLLPDILEMLGFSGVAATIRTLALSVDNWVITRLTFWAIGQLVVYVVLPVFVIRFVLRERVRDFGLSTRGCLHSLPLYGAMFALMLPAVFFFSSTASFQASYPFYTLNTGEELWPRFYLWELLYAVQFIALEFFFRGFILHGTRHRAGSSAIFIMMVPYCMIHFAKPMPETFGAIGAGIILGFMSLKTRSIWLGAALHIAVAWSMDFMALANRNG